ncbi:MAG: hypothetical protein ACWGNV_13790 [Bacteroidales bacterium]
MKAIKYTAAISMVLFLGSIALQAQSTRRNTAQEKKERVTETRQPQKNQSAVKQQTKQTQQVRQAQRTQAQRTQAQRSEPQRAQVRRNEAERSLNTQLQRQNQLSRVEREVRNPGTRPEKRPVSIETGKNPRSTYRKPDSRVIVTPPRDAGSKVNKYSTKRYYSGNYYHNVYPRSRVSLHYHYDTYANHYNVLYYPSYSNIYWTRAMYRDYRSWYPNYHWNYRYGYRIQTISVFDARYSLGEVAMVYGRVYATWYNDETDDYLFFFGGNYPQHQFTMVIPGRIARKFSWRPERYFLGEHITVTGLITTFDGVPEIIVKNKHQVGLY